MNLHMELFFSRRRHPSTEKGKKVENIETAEHSGNNNVDNDGLLNIMAETFYFAATKARLCCQEEREQVTEVMLMYSQVSAL